MDAVTGGGEARSVVAGSAVVPGSVYSSQAPQECVHIHNSDHLATGTTGGLFSKTSRRVLPLLPKLTLFAPGCSHTHTRSHSKSPPPFFKVSMYTYTLASKDTHRVNISSFMYATKIYSTHMSQTIYLLQSREMDNRKAEGGLDKRCQSVEYKMNK